MKAKTLAKRINAARKKARMTRYRLAKVSGVAASTLLLIERGDQKTITIPTAFKLAKALNTTAPKLLGMETE